MVPVQMRPIVFITLSFVDYTAQLARDNSSVDSLECELEIDTAAGKVSATGNQTSPTNLSRDSGLTLSYQHLFDGEEDGEYRYVHQHEDGVLSCKF